MKSGDILLRLVNIRKVYKTKGRKEVVAVDKITTSFKRGEFVIIIGKSGSGKSTLINILGGLDTPTSGDYFCEGNVINNNEADWSNLRNKKIGYIFQEYNLIDSMTVYQNIEIPLILQNLSKTKKDKLINSVLEDVGLLEHINKKTNELSGGQRQRVSIARALVKNPDIILADEPTGALDKETAGEILNLIRGLSTNRLILMVTHDSDIAESYATRLLEISDGELIGNYIKEDINNTFLNTFPIIDKSSMYLKDKVKIVFNKLLNKKFTNFVMAITLSLAFCLTLCISSLESGIIGGYEDYYDSVNNMSSYSFETVPNNDISTTSSYDGIVSDIRNSISSQDNVDVMLLRSMMTAYSKTNSGISEVYNSFSNPSLFDTYNINVINDISNFQNILIPDSKMPSDGEIIVTSRFLEEYYENSNLIHSDYINKEIEVAVNFFQESSVIKDIDNYFANLRQITDGSILREDEVVSSAIPIRYSKIDIPYYCTNKDLSIKYLNDCKEFIDSNIYFDSYDEYIKYMDMYKTKINEIDSTLWNIILNSGGIYFINDISNEDYISFVFNKLYKDINDNFIELNKSIINTNDEFINLKITGVIYNSYVSNIYLTKDSFNNLSTKSSNIDFVEGRLQVSLNNIISDNNTLESLGNNYFIQPLENIDINKKNNYKIYNTDNSINNLSCSQYVIDDYKSESSVFINDIFYITDYTNCKLEGELNNQLGNNHILLLILTNGMLVLVVVLFSMYIGVILNIRKYEIGVFKSLGANNKDVLHLIYFEILSIVIMSFLFSLGLLPLITSYVNSMVVNGDSIVNNIFNIKFIIKNNGLVSVGIVDILVYSFIVFTIIIFISKRAIKKLVNLNVANMLRGEG